MSQETVAIIGVGAALAAAIIPAQLLVRRDLAQLHRDIASVRERLAKIEGAVDVLTKFLIDGERAEDRT